MNYEIEALKLKSLLTVASGYNPDNVQALPEVLEVVKIAQEIAENLYCAIVDENI